MAKSSSSSKSSGSSSKSSAKLTATPQNRRSELLASSAAKGNVQAQQRLTGTSSGNTSGPANNLFVPGVTGPVSPAGTRMNNVAGTTIETPLPEIYNEAVTSQADIDNAIAYINSSDLPASLKSLYIQAVQNWDPNMELNVPNILNTFQKIKSETIDPYYRGLIDLTTQQLKSSAVEMETNRALELEAQGMNAQTAIGDAQKNLEATGLTFSGEGVKQLGEQSAYDLSGQKGAVIPFGGEKIEGAVPTSNRLISTSTKARYDSAVKSLGQQAEQSLGSVGAAGIVAGYTPTSGFVGNIEEQRNTEYQNTMNTLIAEGNRNLEQNVPLKVSNPY